MPRNTLGVFGCSPTSVLEPRISPSIVTGDRPANIKTGALPMEASCTAAPRPCLLKVNPREREPKDLSWSYRADIDMYNDALGFSSQACIAISHRQSYHLTLSVFTTNTSWSASDLIGTCDELEPFLLSFLCFGLSGCFYQAGMVGPKVAKAISDASLMTLMWLSLAKLSIHQAHLPQCLEEGV